VNNGTITNCYCIEDFRFYSANELNVGMLWDTDNGTMPIASARDSVIAITDLTSYMNTYAGGLVGQKYTHDNEFPQPCIRYGHLPAGKSVRRGLVGYQPINISYCQIPIAPEMSAPSTVPAVCGRIGGLPRRDDE